MNDENVTITLHGTYQEVKDQIAHLFDEMHPVRYTETGPDIAAFERAAAATAFDTFTGAPVKLHTDMTPVVETPPKRRGRPRKKSESPPAEASATQSVATPPVEPITAETRPAPLIAAPDVGDPPARTVEQPATDPTSLFDEIPAFLKRDGKPAAKELTLDDCKAKFGELGKIWSIPDCRKFLEPFGVDRISRLPADKFAAFVAAVDKETAGG